MKFNHIFLLVIITLLLGTIFITSNQEGINPSQQNKGIYFIEGSLLINYHDKNLDNKYDEMTISFQISSNISTQVEIMYNLRKVNDSNWMYNGRNIRLSIDVGIQTYSIFVPGVEMYNIQFTGKIRLSLDGNVLTDNEYRWFDSISTEIDFDSQRFAAPPVYIIPNGISFQFKDTNSNGLTDYIEVSVKIKANERTYVDVWANIDYNEQNRHEWIDGSGNSMDFLAGDNAIQITIGSAGFYEKKVVGNITIRVSGRVFPKNEPDYPLGEQKYDFVINYKQFDPPKANLIDKSMSIDFIDDDGNGLYNYLVVKAKLNVTENILLELWVNVNQIDLWRDIGHGNFRESLTKGVHDISIRVPGASIYLSNYAGNVSININGDIILNEEKNLRLRISEQHLDQMYIDPIKFDKAPIRIEINSIQVEYLHTTETLNSESYDFARISFDVIADQKASIDFWVDVHDDRHDFFFANNNYHGDHEITEGTTHIEIDIDGNMLYNSRYDGEAIFSIRGWVQLDERNQYDYPEIEIRKKFSFSDFNPDGVSPLNEAYTEEYDPDKSEEDTNPGISLPILSFLNSSFYLLIILFSYHVIIKKKKFD